MVLKKIKALLARGSKRRRSESTEIQEIPAEAPPRSAPAPVHRGPEVVHHPVALQDLDPDAVRIVKRLTRFEYTAYLVGGCVRDLLLDLKPKDFDIATSATPRQVKRLFSNCRIIGRRFRLAHVYFQNGKIIEVATFRARDGADGPPELAEADAPAAVVADDAEDLLIRDDNVFGSPEEDALRRDFTINALFYDVNAETVIDHADGLRDLRRRLVRTIGDPAVRFREDPIRILRAIKFAARLDFAIEAGTLAALRQTRTEIPKAASPRILEEFNRFCRSGAGRRSFELAFDTGVFEVILPELADTYADSGRPRKILFALLDAIDTRWTDGREVYPGEIFSSLLFAAVAPGLGWSLDPGAPAARDGRDARTLVDDALRPIALRLRIARKDQEHIRQTLTTLQRMVPLKPMRRGAKLALMRRPAFGDAMAMLDALAPLLGGEFAAARTVWAEVAAGHDTMPAHDASAPAEPQDLDDAPAAADGRRGKRRRGRRGGRGRRKDRAGETAAEGTTPSHASPPAEPRSSAPAHARTPAPPAPPARAPKLPPVWDDNYFFAALPSVPNHVGSDDEADSGRYDAGVVPVAETGVEAGEKPSPSGRKRRRGGRRRRKGGPIIPPADSSAPEGDAS
jgi:poly(A) polymerase